MSCRRLVAWAVLFSLNACCNEPGAPSNGEPAEPPRFVFDPSAALSDPESFYAMPWPSDLRLRDGRPDLQGFPRAPSAGLLDGLLEAGKARRGWSVMPVAYFRFSRGIPAMDEPSPHPAKPSSAILLLDVDAASLERGRLIPTVAKVLERDDYAPWPMLAVAPEPGFVLRPETTYAFVVRDTWGKDTGVQWGSNEMFDSMKPGRDASGPLSRVASLYAPLWGALERHAIEPDGVIAATVFTTGDVVADTFDMSEAVRDGHDASIEGLTLDPDDGSEHERFCELHGTVRYPQFQKGEPPFETDGMLALGEDGMPVAQRQETAPVVVTVPKAPMPPGGYPLMLYVHGSGGLSDQVVDRPDKGHGPAHVVAAFGLATASSAMPANPERLPGAGENDYLDTDNPKAFPSTFRQGVFEQRLLLDALRELRIPARVLDGCAGPSLSSGEEHFRFAEDRLTAMGQSMGAMYVNMLAPVEPRIGAVVPTGAGGYWSYFIFETSVVPAASMLLRLMLATRADLSFLHPALGLISLAWEPAEPMVYMPRIARLPLPGHPARPIFEPVGKGDSYFPTRVYDAAALAYGNEQAGEVSWTSMQVALALAGRQGIASYPVSQNRGSHGTGRPYTGVVVQYEGDGTFDTHGVAFRIDEVKYQYGCFLDSFVRTGVATLPERRPLGAPCP